MRFVKVMLASALVICAVLFLAAMSTGASAYVICNHEGDCWHSDRRAPLASLEEGPAFLGSLAIAKKS